jgi:hypothetical protein
MQEHRDEQRVSGGSIVSYEQLDVQYVRPSGWHFVMSWT